ncbi:MAG: PssD/Cps14F family polysaccharide biosynthesis glycosyltransferase [Agathobacter sp.]|nr:PssD/Cps14F family polysaccharide biosynthesis glycosyltransferase [Agathobacter sp.]
MENEKKLKLVFAASSGGHYEQLMMLKPLMEKHDSCVVGEATSYNAKSDIRTYYMHQVNRKEILFIPKMIGNTIRAIKILHKEKPDAIICTGVLAMIPLCLLGKLRGSKLIYIESFAKVTSATMSGKLLYKYADRFYVQWESMLDIYPNAVYKGGIY